MQDKPQPAPYAQIFSDQAVSGEKGLDFQFGGMAKTLAELAWNPNNQTPFTAVVRGGWGRGKTTLLRQTKRLLDLGEQEPNRRQVRAVWFNAWKYPKVGNPCPCQECSPCISSKDWICSSTASGPR